MKKSLIIAIIIFVILVTINTLASNNSDTRPHTVFSTGEQGAALFYDSLNLLGYPVRIGRRPLNTSTNINDIYVIIEPTNPRVDIEMAREMIEWVQMGGRLIFMQNLHSMSILESLLSGGHLQGNIMRYNVGLGEVIVGMARDIQNRGLYNSPAGAVHILNILDEWNADTIWFAEYYHGHRMSETFFSNLPLIIRLSIIHLFIIAVAIILCVGKRFGKPVPVYSEIERTENEHVKSLALLLTKID